MEKKKIYVVIAFGGVYEDKWERNECAFTTKEKCDEYIKERLEKRNKITDEKFEKMEEYLNNEELKVLNQYTDFNCSIKEGKEKEYRDAYDEFENNTKWTLLKDKYNVDRADYEMKENDRTYDFVGYTVKEIDLFED